MAVQAGELSLPSTVVEGEEAAAVDQVVWELFCTTGLLLIVEAYFMQEAQLVLALLLVSELQERVLLLEEEEEEGLDFIPVQAALEVQGILPELAVRLDLLDLLVEVVEEEPETLQLDTQAVRQGQVALRVDTTY